MMLFVVRCVVNCLGWGLLVILELVLENDLFKGDGDLGFLLLLLSIYLLLLLLEIR